MRYALLSDIHGNLPALEAVLENIVTRLDINAIYHLGDLVGYSPWPNEVVARVRSAGIQGVAGNYDSTTATDYKHCGCKYENPDQEALAHTSYEWTRQHITKETKEFLKALPFRTDIRPLGGHCAGPTLTLIHGNHTLNTVYVSEDRSEDFLLKVGKSLGAKVGDVVCFGHTHIPWHRIAEGIHFVNTGSVGRPKDGDWRAGYIILDVKPDTVTSTVIRVEYDLARTVTGIKDSDLPDTFAEYLRTGGKSTLTLPASS